MTDPLRPSMILLAKLGSIIVHYEELSSPNGNEIDKMALRMLSGNADIIEWMRAMRELALIPEKRAEVGE